MHKPKSLLKNKALHTAFLVIAITFALQLTAQTNNSSPYSRYGIGDINPNGLTQSFAMGGASIAIQNDTTPLLFINTGNPASFASMGASTSFAPNSKKNTGLTVAEVGANFNRIQLESSTDKQSLNNASFRFFSLAFPIKKWWGASLGLSPYSTVGYNTVSEQTVSGIGDVEFNYSGSGGINKVYWGNGFKPFFNLPYQFVKSKRYQQLKEQNNDSLIYRMLKRREAIQSFSIGINSSFLFGNVNHEQQSIFPQNSYAFNTSTNTKNHVTGLHFDYGMQYCYTIDTVKNRQLKDNLQIIIGATASAESKLNATTDSLTYSYYLSSLGYEIVRDTIMMGGTKSDMTLPLSYGFGLSLKKGEQWLFSSDVLMANWSSITSSGINQGLSNSMRISTGLQYIPDLKAAGKKSYAKRINYRLGYKYTKSAIVVKGEQLTEKGFTFGLGLPVARSIVLRNFSMMNLGFEIGTRGSTNNGLIKETYFKTLLSVTINDRWFDKRQYD